ncbi:MAG: uroporphyrinogen-III C-methyltransferase [Pseudobutyrivibrio sp.]|nr:uroporphyrinogen-III C-methyltransferase [Pseudobutyrivibrio sp.]
MSELGKVVLIGAGPGEKGLLTLKGYEYLKQADCIVYDRLLNTDFLDLVPSNCEKIYVGKANHFHTVPQDEINQLLYDNALKHKLVVRLKGGDPYVFGRGGEEALFLRDRNVEVEVVPGISSSIAAVASAGIPITHRGLSKGFQVITAHSKKDKISDIDYSQLLDEDITYVFLMGLSHVKDIADGLMAAGRASDTPAAVISSGTTNHQKKVVGVLATINDLVIEAGLLSPAIIVVGKVVTLSEDLNFFEKRPLFGKKFFLPVIDRFEYTLSNGTSQTKPNELKEKLIKNGAEVVAVKSGAISPIKFDFSFLSKAKKGDYLVFTSPNGVKSFFWNLYEVAGEDIRAIADYKFACIGKKTADSLGEFGIKADVISAAQNGKDLATTLNQVMEKDADIFWLCQKNTSEDFENTVSKDHAITKIICYENQEVNTILDDKQLEEIRECDIVIFTSGSNARFAIKNYKDYLPNDVISIGPACSRITRELGLEVAAEAEISSYDGIVECIFNSYIR